MHDTQPCRSPSDRLQPFCCPLHPDTPAAPASPRPLEHHRPTASPEHSLARTLSFTRAEIGALGLVEVVLGDRMCSGARVWDSQRRSAPPGAEKLLERYRGDGYLFYDADAGAIAVPVLLRWRPILGGPDCEIAAASVSIDGDPAADHAALVAFSELGRICRILETVSYVPPSDRRLGHGVECAICCEPHARPVELSPCKHVFCLACVVRLSAEPRPLACPACRAVPSGIALLEKEHMGRWRDDAAGYLARLADAATCLPARLPRAFRALCADPRWLLAGDRAPGRAH
eukprot:tig00000042_g15660.t1